MSRRAAGIYAAGSTAFAVLAIAVASAMFGLFAPSEAADNPEAATAAATTIPVDVSPAYASALGDLDAMRAAALNDVAAQVVAQRAALQEQALREVEAQRAALQAQALGGIDAQRAAAQQALAAELAARALAQATPVPAVPAVPTVIPTIVPTVPPTVVPTVPVATATPAATVATPRPTATVRTLTAEAQSEITKKTNECNAKTGSDRTECLAEVAKLRARYGL